MTRTKLYLVSLVLDLGNKAFERGAVPDLIKALPDNTIFILPAFEKLMVFVKLFFKPIIMATNRP